MSTDFSFENPLVLTEAVLQAMGKDHLLAAVFLSFEFQPEFFEDAILAPLCRIDGRGSATIRRLMLEEHLRGMAEVLVLYDQQALRADGPLRQRIAATPVSWPDGFVHAKHALLLTEGDAGRALLLVTTSANLTRTGWWQNVEVADIERLVAGSASPLRQDLLDLLDLLRTRLRAPPDHPALQLINDFVREALHDGKGLPRLWLGCETLPEFLAEHVPPARRSTRLECLAPYVDETAAPVAALAQALKADATTVLFPLDRLGDGAASASWRDGVLALDGGRFGILDGELDLGPEPGSPGGRFVHAKAIRIIDDAAGCSWNLVGSPNLSVQAHAGWLTSAPRSNVETAILRKSPGTASWFRPQVKEPQPAQEAVPEEEVEGPVLNIRVTFDWRTELAQLWCAVAPLAVSLAPAHAGGAGEHAFCVVTTSAAESWVALSPKDAERLRAELQTSNLLSAWAPGHQPAIILVEESNAGLAPSKVDCKLSASEILRHWSLLSDDQRALHLQRALLQGAENEDDSTLTGAAAATAPAATMFDAYSGITHGFLIMKQRLLAALNKGPQGEAEIEPWMLGQRHDSLGTLLAQVLSEHQTEPVRNIVFALSARELLTLLKSARPGFLQARQKAVAQLEQSIACLETAGWKAIDADGAPGSDPTAFRQWIESNWTAAPGAAQ